MTSRRADEFSIIVRWVRAGEPRWGDRPAAVLPGFHVTAGWANEGESFYPIDYQRISSADLTALGRIIDAAFNCDGSFSRTVDDLAVAHDSAADAHTEALRRRVETLRKQLAEAEAAVSDV